MRFVWSNQCQSGETGPGSAAQFISSCHHILLWLIDRSNQMSLRALRSPSDSSSHMGRPARLMLNSFPLCCCCWCVIASKVRSSWKKSSLLHLPCKSSCHGVRISASAAKLGQFGLAAEQLSEPHRLPCDKLNRRNMDAICLPKNLVRREKM